MTTWTYANKNALALADYNLLIGGTYKLLVGSGHQLLITPISTGGWVDATKRTASYSHALKNTTSWTNITKN